MEYCNLALVETKARLRGVATYLDEHLTIDVPVRIHMVGCPNSCGQRQIADIGLQGVKLKSDKGMVEAFELYVGGTLLNGGKFNEKLKGKVNADALQDVLLSFLTFFKDEKLPSETFYEFVGRVGIEELQNHFTQILAEVLV
jgi:ferredoxin-nitrite reductase